jgi:hypothetical protein
LNKQKQHNFPEPKPIPPNDIRQLKAIEDQIGKPFSPDFIPDMLHGIQLGAIRRQGQQLYIGGELEDPQPDAIRPHLKPSLSVLRQGVVRLQPYY